MSVEITIPDGYSYVAFIAICIIPATGHVHQYLEDWVSQGTETSDFLKWLKQQLPEAGQYQQNSYDKVNITLMMLFGGLVSPGYVLYWGISAWFFRLAMIWFHSRRFSQIETGLYKRMLKAAQFQAFVLLWVCCLQMTMRLWEGRDGPLTLFVGDVCYALTFHSEHLYGLWRRKERLSGGEESSGPSREADFAEQIVMAFLRVWKM